MSYYLDAGGGDFDFTWQSLAGQTTRSGKSLVPLNIVIWIMILMALTSILERTM